MLEFTNVVGRRIAQVAPGQGTQKVGDKYTQQLSRINFNEGLVKTACRDIVLCLGLDVKIAEIKSRNMDREVFDFLLRLYLNAEEETADSLKKDQRWQKFLVQTFEIWVLRLCGEDIVSASLHLRAKTLMHKATMFVGKLSDTVDGMAVMSKWGIWAQDPVLLFLCADAIRDMSKDKQESFMQTVAHAIGSRDKKPTRNELVDLFNMIKLGVNSLN